MEYEERQISLTEGLKGGHNQQFLFLGYVSKFFLQNVIKQSFSNLWTNFKILKKAYDESIGIIMIILKMCSYHIIQRFFRKSSRFLCVS